MADELERLREEVKYYKDHYEMMIQIHDSQVETIKTYHKIVMLQEAELKKLKGEKE